jgi:acyl carrier protein
MATELLEEQVKEIIADIYMRSPRERPLTAADIGSDDALYSTEEGEESLGFDSLDALEIAFELELAFDVVMPVELDPVEVKTVRQITTLIEDLLKEQRPESGASA